MIKNLLFVFVLLFQGFLMSINVVAADPGLTYPVLKKNLMALKATESTELPELKLLETALAGYEKVAELQKLDHPEVITIIDFGLPSDKERLWVIDLVHSKVLFHCLVSHGRNSGDLMAETFFQHSGFLCQQPWFLYHRGYIFREKWFISHAGMALKRESMTRHGNGPLSCMVRIMSPLTLSGNTEGLGAVMVVRQSR